MRTIRTKIRFVGTVVASLLVVIGLAGVPEDIGTWHVWLQDIAEVMNHEIARWIFVVIAVAGFIILYGFPRLWRNNRSEVAEPDKEQSSEIAVVSPLISLIDLMREAEKLGWRFTDDGSQHIFDFVRALSDAGSTKAIQFWGREKQRIEPMTKERALSDIDPKYWRKFKIDGISCLELSHSTGEAQGIASDNLKTTTEADGNLTQHGLYADIHLDRAQAVNWLKSQTIVPARIHMTDAAVRAYEATQGTSIAERAEKSKRSEKSGSGVEAWYAMALTKDENMKVYGRKPPSRNLVEIPRSGLEAFMFENDANELVDQFDDGNRYVDLEVLEADFLRSLEKIKREAG